MTIQVETRPPRWSWSSGTRCPVASREVKPGSCLGEGWRIEVEVEGAGVVVV